MKGETWYVVTQREKCLRCYGLGRVRTDVELVQASNGGLMRPPGTENDWIPCEVCNADGYIEKEVDLRQAISEILNESIARDNG